MRRQFFWGAFDEDLALVGVLCAEGFFLRHLYVQRRGEGIGKALYSFYEEILKNRMEEGQVVRLNATLSSVPFYEALGFSVKDQVQEIYPTFPKSITMVELFPKKGIAPSVFLLLHQ